MDTERTGHRRCTRSAARKCIQACVRQRAWRRAFTVRDLALTLACLLIAIGLVISLGAATRGLSQASACTSNLETLFGGLMAYVNTYNSFPPYSPYPTYGSGSVAKNGLNSTSGFDPSIGWIMTYGLGMTPPATDSTGHFQWWVLSPEELPSVCVCPAADFDQLFTASGAEVDVGNPESLVFQYAAFYQTPATCRAATPVVSGHDGSQSTGGRNPPIPGTTMPFMTSLRQPCRNFSSVSGGAASDRGVPGVYVFQKKNPATDPNAWTSELYCWVQAVHPAEVQQPSRLFYMGDSRDYRINGNGGAQHDAWYVGYGNELFLGSRHNGYSNVMYLDGQVNRDNQAHPHPEWSLAYDGLGHLTNAGPADQWRAATFADDISLAYIHTQHHMMPVLMVKGWEYFFSADGIAAR